jgi:predicted RNA binding protein YcfA (HicA-like mRNA interferase family)
MRVREVIKLIEASGWFIVRMKGSHRQYKHPDRQGVVTIAGNLDDELAKGTLNSVLKQSGLKYGREKSASISDCYRKIHEEF